MNVSSRYECDDLDLKLPIVNSYYERVSGSNEILKDISNLVANYYSVNNRKPSCLYLGRAEDRQLRSLLSLNKTSDVVYSRSKLENMEIFVVNSENHLNVG